MGQNGASKYKIRYFVPKNRMLIDDDWKSVGRRLREKRTKLLKIKID